MRSKLLNETIIFLADNNEIDRYLIL